MRQMGLAVYYYCYFHSTYVFVASNGSFWLGGCSPEIVKIIDEGFGTTCLSSTIILFSGLKLNFLFSLFPLL